jgi:hypothetical protein
VKEDGFAEIAEALESGVGSAGVLVYLLQEKIEEGFGEFVGIRGVAAGVFVDGFLAPGIESSGVKHVGLGEENLRRGDDDADHRGSGWLKNPDGDGVIGVRPEEADGFHSFALGEKRVEGGEFVALRGGGGLQDRQAAGGFPLLPDAVGVGRLIGDAPMEIPEAGVAGGFKEQAGHYEVGVAEAVRREMMRGEEGLEAGAHAGGAFEGVGFCVEFGEELGEGGIGGTRSFRGTSRVLGREERRRHKEQENYSKKKS